MEKQYLCHLTKQLFNSKEEALDYFKTHHVNIIEEENEIVTKDQETLILLKSLEERFPDYHIKVEHAWMPEVGYLVELEKDNTKIQQHYLDTSKYSYGSDSRDAPNTLNDLFLAIEDKFKMMKYLKESMLQVAEFEYIKCLGFSYGYSSDEHSYDFVYQLKGQPESIRTNFYPWDDRNNQTIESFVQEIKQYIVSFLEGKPEARWLDGYFQGYNIDGVPIETLLNKGKKVKLEILE